MNSALNGFFFLFFQVLVESVQKLVSDNESLRSDAISLREKVQERAPRLSLHNIYIYI